MSIKTDITIPKSLHDYAEDRTNAVKMAKTAFDAIERADNLVPGYGVLGISFGSGYTVELKDVIKRIDQRFWRHAFYKTGLHSLMDAEARKSYENALEQHPLPFTVENVRSEFLSFQQSADLMFARGVYNAFRKLPGNYKTNSRDPFKIDRKAIMVGIFRKGWGRGDSLHVTYGGYAIDTLNDIDRVFCTLDQKTYTPRSLESTINDSMSAPPWVFENDYYKIKGYNNGNAHILFKRQDLLDRANKIIGDYCNGTALATG